MDYILWLEGGLFVLMMGLSGFFSSSETSLFSLSDIQLEQMRRDQHPRIGLIQRLLSQPRRLIITILIGNELVNVTASVISAAIVIKVLGAENKWINLLIMVPLLLLLGEITPKVLAIRHNIAFAGFESKLIEIFARLIKPIRFVVRKVADWSITLVIGRDRSRGNIITEDMFRVLTREAVGEGALDHFEAQFIEQIFDFGNKTLEDVMTPRSDIFFLAIDMPLEEIIVEVCKSRHTKIPIYQENRDNVCGILHVRDLLGIDIDKFSRDPHRQRRLLRKPYFVPESKLAADLFRTFRERKLSIALTVDEYGGITGLVTMEDLLECIFGEIHSPSDEVDQVSIKDLGEGRYAVDGSMPIADFNQEMNSNLSEEWGETIGGLLLHHYGELPPEGDKIEIDEFRFRVIEVEENRIKTVEFEKIPEVTRLEEKSSDSAEDPIQKQGDND
jgi:CBS domain containing-hemolysin-like protein